VLVGLGGEVPFCPALDLAAVVAVGFAEILKLRVPEIKLVEVGQVLDEAFGDLLTKVL